MLDDQTLSNWTKRIALGLGLEPCLGGCIFEYTDVYYIYISKQSSKHCPSPTYLAPAPFGLVVPPDGRCFSAAMAHGTSAEVDHCYLLGDAQQGSTPYMTFHSTDWFIGIFITATYNFYTAGCGIIPFSQPDNHGFGCCSYEHWTKKTPLTFHEILVGWDPYVWLMGGAILWTPARCLL